MCIYGAQTMGELECFFFFFWLEGELERLPTKNFFCISNSLRL